MSDNNLSNAGRALCWFFGLVFVGLGAAAGWLAQSIGASYFLFGLLAWIFAVVCAGAAADLFFRGER